MIDETPDDEAEPSADAADVTSDVEDDAQDVQPKPRGQRQRYEKAERGVLADWDLMASVAPDATVDVTVEDEEGTVVQDDHGDPYWIGDAIKRSAALVASLGNAKPRFRGLAFGNSVTFSFSASDEEVRRSEDLLQQIEAVDLESDGADELLRKLQLQALPATLVGAHMATDFIRAALDDPIGTAISYGTSVNVTWESFARHLAKEDLTLTFRVPGPTEESISIASGDAARVVEQLRQEHTRRPRTVTAVGTLTLADADKNVVGLKLDAEAARDPLLRGKRILKCEIASAVRDSIRDQGLWNMHVRARVRIYFDTDSAGRSTPNAPLYSLIEVEPRYS